MIYPGDEHYRLAADVDVMNLLAAADMSPRPNNKLCNNQTTAMAQTKGGNFADQVQSEIGTKYQTYR